MIGPVRLVYYMLMNKGKINSNDIVAIAARINMPIPVTITGESANRSIQIILNAAAKETGGDVNKVHAHITTFDFCHFIKTGDIAKTSTKRSKHIKTTSTFGKTFWRKK